MRLSVSCDCRWPAPGSADEVQRAAGFFVSWRPVWGRSEAGGGIRERDVVGMRERSQFGGSGRRGRIKEVFEVIDERLCGGVLDVLAAAAEFGVGAVPGAFEGGDLALDAGEELGGGGVGEEGGGEGRAGGFGEEGAGEVGLDAEEAALLPIGAEHGFDVEEFGGGLGAEVAEVVGGEGVVFSRVLAGDDDGGGVDAVFEGVEAGGGLALGGAGSGRHLGVGPISGDLCRDRK